MNRSQAFEFPTFHQLELVAAVAEYGGFTAAARALTLSQPSLTAQVQAAERALGVALFSRLPGGVELTEAGRCAIEFAHREAALRRDLLGRLAEIGGGKKGRLVIGASTAVGEHYLPDALSAFRAKYPDVELDVLVGNSSEILARLNSRAVDLAVMATPKNRTNLRVETLFTDEVVLFKDSRAKIDVDALGAGAFGELTLITREEGSDVREQGLASLYAQGFAARRTMAVSTNLAVVRMVRAGMGIGLLSESALKPYLSDGLVKIIPIPGWHCFRQLDIVQPTNSESALARRFWDFVTSWVHDHPGQPEEMSLPVR